MWLPSWAKGGNSCNSRPKSSINVRNLASIDEGKRGVLSQSSKSTLETSPWGGGSFAKWITPLVKPRKRVKNKMVVER